ncbi:hypothetical protein ACE1TH_10625 [Shouchella sp. JSM 1781072]|uniref:hypothetical protein n=1 Tax=Shouchella sp. JSM 1781072 TaxID=3344581 RepID=UPI0035C2361C
MRHIIATETADQWKKQMKMKEQLEDEFNLFCEKVNDAFFIVEKPNTIIWTPAKHVMNTFSTVPVPAFTRENQIYLTGDLSEWSSYFLQLLTKPPQTNVKQYFERFNRKSLLTIVGHEWMHHSNLFVDDFDDGREDEIWFEEGMCDYIARKCLLTEAEFEEVVDVEQTLVHQYAEEFPFFTIDQFGQTTYAESTTKVMYAYWKSFLAIKDILESGNYLHILDVFNRYQDWHKQGRAGKLFDYLMAK